MTDQELRALVRESIAKQLGDGCSPEGGWRSPSGLATTAGDTVHMHASHAIYMIPTESDNGPCIIEPSVPCTHCNYCKSHGH